MLVHRQPVRAVAVDRSGNYMATSATDRTLKIWDIRAFKCLHEYKVGLQFRKGSIIEEWDVCYCSSVCFF